MKLNTAIQWLLSNQESKLYLYDSSDDESVRGFWLAYDPERGLVCHDRDVPITDGMVLFSYWDHFAADGREYHEEAPCSDCRFLPSSCRCEKDEDCNCVDCRESREESEEEEDSDEVSQAVKDALARVGS